MSEILLHTQSICPVCLDRIPAYYEQEGDNIYFCKTCPEHGDFRVLQWRGAQMYHKWREQSVHAEKQHHKPEGKRGCPFDCGLCQEHEGGTCTAVLEVTYRCNMNCKICFADATKEQFDPTLEQVRGMYETAKKNGGFCSIQLSGGEPTVRDDLPQIIAMGKEMGFPHIQVNSNGLRIAKEIDYLKRLKEAGADLIYLQFDGLKGEIYETIRGRDILKEKLQAIENCKQVGIGVLLVPTVVPGVNLDQLGEIIRFAKAQMTFPRTDATG